MHEYYSTNIPEPYAQDNHFKNLECYTYEKKSFESFKNFIPELIIPSMPDAITAWDKAWEIAHQNIRLPTKKSGFISPFIDTAFNKCTFMWDSVFIGKFAKYAVSDLGQCNTLDNFYTKQEEDGFIPREINYENGMSTFHKHDPSSTGPNIFAWCELEHYQFHGDKERLKLVYPALCAYHLWLKKNRTWKNGSYWSTGWGCGMDNQKRNEIEIDSDMAFEFHHNWLSWLDATTQALLSAQCISKIAHLINEDATEFESESSLLLEYIENDMWCPERKFFFDIDRYGKRCDVIGIAAFWTLLCDGIDEEKKKSLIYYLNDEKHFNRLHRVPTLSASDSNFDPKGAYWNGGVWSPTTYMVIQGLKKCNQNKLANDIAHNHFKHVLEVFKNTNTFWELYAPDYTAQGSGGYDAGNEGKEYLARPNFVGWSGIAPIALLLEHILGVEYNAINNTLYITNSFDYEFEIKRYPISLNKCIDIKVLPKNNHNKEAKVLINNKTLNENEVVNVVIQFND